LIVVSTSPFSRNAPTTIRTLVHPAPVIAVHLSMTEETPPANTDLTFFGPKDFDAIADRILEELKSRGVLAEAIGAKQQFHYSI
jgi:bifunctional enzyme CysN/CysC